MQANWRFGPKKSQKNDSSWNRLPSLPILVGRGDVIVVSRAPLTRFSADSHNSAEIPMIVERTGTSFGDLTTVVEAALSGSHAIAGRNLRFEIHQDHVVLRGIVRSYYQKQLAQESLRSVSGVSRITNEIEVVAT